MSGEFEIAVEDHAAEGSASQLIPSFQNIRYLQWVQHAPQPHESLLFGELCMITFNLVHIN